MTNYVPGSLTEIIIAHGARSQSLDPGLLELAPMILQDLEDFSQISDPAIRDYMQRGAALVQRVLHTYGS